MNRREAELQAREKYVIDAAQKILFEKGFEAATLVEIAERAEISRPTLYKYFKSKEEIFLAVHMRGMKIRWRMLKKGMAAREDPAEKLYAFGEAYYEFVNKYPEYLRIQLFWDSFGLNLKEVRPESFAEFTRLNNKARKELKSIIAEVSGCGGGNAVEINLEWAAGHLFHTLRTVLNQTIFPVNSENLYNHPEHYYQFLRLFIKGLQSFSLKSAPAAGINYSLK